MGWEMVAAAEHEGVGFTLDSINGTTEYTC